MPLQNSPNPMNPNPKDNEELDVKEIELLHYIRTRVPYGEIVIETRAGLPYRVKKITEYHLLDS